MKKLLFSLAVISLVVAGCKDLVDDINLQIDNQLIDAGHHVLFGPSRDEKINAKKAGKKRE